MIFNLITKAKDLFYNNASSGLTATNTQDAIDEIKSSLANYATNTSLANALAWKVLKADAMSSVSLAPIWNSFNEIQVLARCIASSTEQYCTSIVIPSAEIPSSTSSLKYDIFSGSHFTSSNGVGTRIDLYQGTVTLGAFYVDGTYISDASKLRFDVLYR